MLFSVIKKEFNKDLNQAKYFAGHSLGEYSALSSAGYLSFSDTIKLLRLRGEAMQNAVPKGEGGMLAVLGSNIVTIEKILEENQNEFFMEIANDNSDGQLVLSGKNNDLMKFVQTPIDLHYVDPGEYFPKHWRNDDTRSSKSCSTNCNRIRTQALRLSLHQQTLSKHSCRNK